MSIYFTNGFERSLGTFPLKGDVLRETIAMAAEIGYRAFDTAQMYGNEAETGQALEATGLARDDFFITTKVENDNYAADKFMSSVEQSLDRLRVDHVDVLLLHWPPADFNIEPGLVLLAEAAQRGYARHIGVSNYTAQMMRDAKRIIDLPIVTNQVEFHPLLNQDILLAASAETGIPLSAYCAVARGEILNYPEISAIAERYGKTAFQIALRWILQKGVSMNAMSTKRNNLSANFDIMDFTLSSCDMFALDNLTHTGYRIVNKNLVPWAPDFD